ncbi:hypothetical protein J4423_03215 [Candidatus Pacearchaeota archaeon]|nr:hypothetical protein [Candidatus Pacearchaeota archaeon]
MVFEKKRGFADYVSDGFNAVSEGVRRFASTKFDTIIDKAEWKLMGLQDRIIKKFMHTLFFGISAVFLSLSAFYLMKEYFNLSNTLSFFTIGILVFLIGIFIKLTERRYN